jgi:hypothetical protein
MVKNMKNKKILIGIAGLLLAITAVVYLLILKPNMSKSVFDFKSVSEEKTPIPSTDYEIIAKFDDYGLDTYTVVKKSDQSIKEEVGYTAWFFWDSIIVNNKNYLIVKHQGGGSADGFYYGVYELGENEVIWKKPSRNIETPPDAEPELDGNVLKFYQKFRGEPNDRFEWEVVLD